MGYDKDRFKNVYVFHCPNPGRHYGYGHSFELCYHPVSFATIADRVFDEYSTNSETIRQTVIEALDDLRTETGLVVDETRDA